jgi:integrase
MPNEALQLVSACVAGKGPNDFVIMRAGSDGQRVSDFRTGWKNACERAGRPGLLFHDLRRTGARNLRRLQVSEGVIMKIGDWRTRAVFERYNIVDETDLADAARRMDEKRAARAVAETDNKTDNPPAQNPEQRLQ